MLYLFSKVQHVIKTHQQTIKAKQFGCIIILHQVLFVVCVVVNVYCNMSNVYNNPAQLKCYKAIFIFTCLILPKQSKPIDTLNRAVIIETKQRRLSSLKYFNDARNLF